MQPPRDVKGGFYADILFKSDNEGTRTASGINLLTYVGGKETQEKEAGIEIINVEERNKALQVDVKFTNKGTVYVNPAVELVLNRNFPQVEAEDGRIIPGRTENINSSKIPASDNNPVLPGTDRLFNFLIPTDLEPGEYEIAVRVDYGGEEPAVTKTRFTKQGGRTDE